MPPAPSELTSSYGPRREPALSTQAPCESRGPRPARPRFDPDRETYPLPASIRGLGHLFGNERNAPVVRENAPILLDVSGSHDHHHDGHDDHEGSSQVRP